MDREHQPRGANPTQASLFPDPDPLGGPASARRTDPDTSHEAARRVTDSGAVVGQRRVVLDALRRCPGSTSAELAHRAGLDRFLVARRLPELERMRLAERDTPKVCPVNGTRALTWKAR